MRMHLQVYSLAAEERRLAQIGPIGECCHLRIGQRIGANNDGQRIASQRLRGEHVDLTKYEFCQF
jgi:hypothetical protein